MIRFRVFRKCWLGTSYDWLPYGRGLDAQTNVNHLSSLLAKAITALASALCIVLSLSFYEHYDPKTDLCVLIAVPGLCLVVSATACASFTELSVCSNLIFTFSYMDKYLWQNKQTQSFFAKLLFRSSLPTSVAVECIWTTCFVIFDLSMLSPSFPLV
jgi:hypothetical protein